MPSLGIMAPKTLAEAGQLTIEHPDIAQAVEHTYAVMANRTDVSVDRVHQLTICNWASIAMCSRLASLGYEVSKFGRSMHIGSYVFDHWYPLINSDRGPIVADTQWQQFLAKGRRRIHALPRAVVGTREEVIDTMRGAGMARDWMVFWTQERSECVDIQREVRYA